MGKTLILLTTILISTQVFGSDIEKLIKKLENKETRIEAIREIERIGKPAVKHLRQIVKDKGKNRDVRISAIILCGKSKARESQAELEEILETDKDELCREASAIALGNLGEKKALPKLKKALNDQSVNVRMRVVWALAKLGDNSGKDLAMQTLTKDENVTGKLLASEALEAIGEKDVIPQLQQYLNDNNVWTRIYTKLTIKKLEMVGLSEQERFAFLKESLKDNQFEVSQWAAIELAKIDTPEAIQILKSTAKDSNNPGSYTAAKVLMRLLEQGKISKEELER